MSGGRCTFNSIGKWASYSFNGHNCKCRYVEGKYSAIFREGFNLPYTQEIHYHLTWDRKKDTISPPSPDSLVGGSFEEIKRKRAAKYDVSDKGVLYEVSAFGGK